MSSAGPELPTPTPDGRYVVEAAIPAGDRRWARATDVLLFTLLLVLLVVVVLVLLRLDTRSELLEELLRVRLAGCVCPGATPDP